MMNELDMSTEVRSSSKSDGGIVVPTKIARIPIITLEAEAGTTGAKGGDAGHGARTYLRFEITDGDCASLGNCDVRVDVANLPKVELIFGGDWEIEAVKDALRHMLATLDEQTSTKLKGVVTSWNCVRRVGTISLVKDESQRFFLFGSRILSGPEPTVGSLVDFERSPLPTLPNKLPLADHVHVAKKACDKAVLQ
jgi:hypothetical protein